MNWKRLEKLRSENRVRSKSVKDRNFGLEMRSVGETLAFSPAEYLGVTRSTRTLFQDWLPLSESDLRSARRRRRIFEAVLSSGVERLVFSGFGEGYAALISDLAREGRRAPRIFVLWHASVLQNEEDCNWKYLQQILELAESQRIYRVGFLKRGMAELISRARHIRTGFVMNRVERIPEAPGHPRSEDRLHLGFFCAGQNWRKNPYAMIAASSLIEKASLSGIFDTRSLRWCEMLGVATDRVYRSTIDHKALLQELGAMHCNLYVTLSESSPLIPLESLSLGVPCLVSPTSHLFEGQPLLEEKLIVSRADEPQKITRGIHAAVESRAELVEAYAEFATTYNEDSRRSVLEFVKF